MPIKQRPAAAKRLRMGRPASHSGRRVSAAAARESLQRAVETAEAKVSALTMALQAAENEATSATARVSELTKAMGILAAEINEELRHRVARPG